MNNQKKISICGLDCGVCPAYLATISNDDNLREKTVLDWNKKYKDYIQQPITKNDINCLGCLSSGPLYQHCLECEIRKCGLEKHVDNCGKCQSYKSCEKIANFHKQVPDAKKNSDKIHFS